MVWYFIGVNIINRILHGRLEIRNIHCYYDYIINRAFRSENEMVWYFIGVNIINRILHGRLEIRNFSTRREISYLRAAM